MLQGFQKYFFQNLRKCGVEPASLIAQPILPEWAESALLPSWKILCPIFYNFEKNICGILEANQFTLQCFNFWDLKLH